MHRYGLFRPLFAALALLLAFAPSAVAGAGEPLAAARETLQSAHAALRAKFDAAKANSDDAYDILSRLVAESESLDDARARTDTAYLADRTLQANLDAAWVTAVTTGVCPKPAASGASETCFRAKSDGTLQPLAVYVPAALAHNPGPAPLVVVLRGRGETETDALSRGEWHALADNAHAILIAPYGRGLATYNAAATQDVIDALDSAERTIAVDRARTYLAGFSMGGIAAFHVAGFAPKRFVALLSVLGALSPSDRDTMRSFDEPIYVVSSEHDQFIPLAAAVGTVNFLRNIDRTVRYYEQKDGVHSLRSVLPALTDAWRDMFAGIRSPMEPGAGAPATSAPATTEPQPVKQRPT